MRHVTLFLLSAVVLVLQANALPYSNQLQSDLEQGQEEDSGYHYGRKISGNPFFTPQNSALELQKGNLNNQAKDQRDLRPSKGNPFLIRATEPTGSRPQLSQATGPIVVTVGNESPFLKPGSGSTDQVSGFPDQFANGPDAFGYPSSQDQFSQQSFEIESGLSSSCNEQNKVCVSKNLCVNGFTSERGSESKKCNENYEVCCSLQSNTQENEIKIGQQETEVPEKINGFGQGSSKQPSLGYPSGGLFGSENPSSDDKSSTGDSNSSPTSRGEGDPNGYLPPIGSDASINVPAFSQPPRESTSDEEGEASDASPTGIRLENAFPPAPEIPPQVGCAAALICVEEQYCTMTGVISPDPVRLTSQQLTRRAPLSSCRNPETGIIGKCCRDPNYVDPWPTGNLPANYTGGFDEMGFPTFLNIAKTRPQKQGIKTPQQPFKTQQPSKQPIRPQQSLNTLQPIRPQQPFIRPEKPLRPEQPMRPEQSFKLQENTFAPRQPPFPQQPFDSQRTTFPQLSIDSQQPSLPQKPIDSQRPSIPQQTIDSQRPSFPQQTIDSQRPSFPQQPSDSQQPTFPQPSTDLQQPNFPQQPIDSQQASFPQPSIDLQQATFPQISIDVQRPTFPQPSIDSQQSSSPQQPIKSQGPSFPQQNFDSQGPSFPEQSIDSQRPSFPQQTTDSQGPSFPQQTIDLQRPSFPQLSIGSQQSSSPQQPIGSQVPSFPQQTIDSQRPSFPQQTVDSQRPSFPQQTIDSQRPSFPQLSIDSQQSSSPQQPIDSQGPSFPQQTIDSQRPSFPQQTVDSQQTTFFQQSIDSKLPTLPQKPVDSQRPTSPQQSIDLQQPTFSQQPIDLQQSTFLEQSIDSQQPNFPQQSIDSQQPTFPQQSIDSQQPTFPQQSLDFQQPNSLQQPTKTFPSAQQISDAISNTLQNFRPGSPSQTPTDTPLNSPSESAAPENKPQGVFDLPNSPNYPSFPNFPHLNPFNQNKAPKSSFEVPNVDSTNENSISIAPHTPGTQCGLINKVQRPSGLSDVEVAFGEIPWQAMILSNNDRKILCTGAIVATNAILTAAHCVDGYNPSEISIKAGEWKLGYELKFEEPLPFEIVKVASIESHPGYSRGQPSYDMALLFLEHPVSLDQHVDTICLGDSPVIKPGRKCIAIGWGKTVLQVHLAGAIMHSIDVDILSRDECSQRLQNAESPLSVDDSLVCCKAHKVNNNMCQVDVGGPLACDRGDGFYEILGVYSQDTGCLPTNQVTTFAVIDSQWVKDTIQSAGVPNVDSNIGGYPTTVSPVVVSSPQTNLPTQQQTIETAGQLSPFVPQPGLPISQQGQLILQSSQPFQPYQPLQPVGPSAPSLSLTLESFPQYNRPYQPTKSIRPMNPIAVIRNERPVAPIAGPVGPNVSPQIGTGIPSYVLHTSGSQSYPEGGDCNCRQSNLDAGLNQYLPPL